MAAVGAVASRILSSPSSPSPARLPTADGDLFVDSLKSLNLH